MLLLDPHAYSIDALVIPAEEGDGFRIGNVKRMGTCDEYKRASDSNLRDDP